MSAPRAQHVMTTARLRNQCKVLGHRPPGAQLANPLATSLRRFSAEPKDLCERKERKFDSLPHKRIVNIMR